MAKVHKYDGSTLEFRNPTQLKNGWIDCEINHADYGWIPFTCNPLDTEAEFDASVLFDRLSASPTMNMYIAPSLAEQTAEAIGGVRYIRNNILTSVVDPMVSNPLRWAALTPEKQQEWAEYRVALLDITATSPEVSEVWNPTIQNYELIGVTWPVAPAAI